jgi:hypothetical protein
MNVEFAVNQQFSDVFGLRMRLQGSPAGDGLNGAFSTAAKEEQLRLPVDFETAGGFTEAWSGGVRVLPAFTVGPLTLQLGASMQVEFIDWEDADDAGGETGSSLLFTRTTEGSDRIQNGERRLL